MPTKKGQKQLAQLVKEYPSYYQYVLDRKSPKQKENWLLSHMTTAASLHSPKGVDIRDGNPESFREMFIIVTGGHSDGRACGGGNTIGVYASLQDRRYEG